MSHRSESKLSPYIARMRSKLLGAPTSIALATVLTDTRGLYSPVRRYWGTTSFTLVAATKRFTGNPIRFAISPAARLPKFPLGTETTRPPGPAFLSAEARGAPAEARQELARTN